ncbi:hypothetical protein O8W32_02570 [Methanomassiliicoccales archaeon LGM-DZ1]|nr:hypothetical protein O8W32_02570 [Methanomassiliicoccales archaeon LGM-DZ1]
MSWYDRFSPIGIQTPAWLPTNLSSEAFICGPVTKPAPSLSKGAEFFLL